jgi:hypothetical protein
LIVDDADAFRGDARHGLTGLRLHHAGPIRHAGMIAHAPEHGCGGRVSGHAAIREVLLAGEHQRGVEEFRIAAATAQQPREGIELPLASRSIEESFRSRPEQLAHGSSASRGS